MEKDTIDFNKILPNTKGSLLKDLKSIGIKDNMDLIVHSSLSKLGWVVGGEVTVVEALKESASSGTLVMPSQTTHLSEPSYWGNPAVPESWWEVIRETTPAFSKDITITREMGKVVECLRTNKDTIRSNHPQVSFIASGKNKDYIIDNHSLEYGLGDESPLGKLYQLDGYILLLGVDFNNNTSIHLGEHRTKKMKVIKQGAPIMENNKRVWKEFNDYESSSCDFLDIQREFFKLGKYREGKIGDATSYLMKIRDLVDFATSYIDKNHKDES